MASNTNIEYEPKNSTVENSGVVTVDNPSDVNSKGGRVSEMVIDSGDLTSREETRVSDDVKNSSDGYRDDVGGVNESRNDISESICRKESREDRDGDTRVSEVKIEEEKQNEVRNDGVDAKSGGLIARDDKSGESVGKSDETESGRGQEVRKGEVSQYSSWLSEFDEYVAGGRTEMLSVGMSRALKYGFQVGDMVWGKVKSHPWWPGIIYNEAFASPSVQRARKYGHVLVAFFGDSSYGWFDPAELIPFDENFAEKSRQMNSRSFIKAVEEAVDEVSRRSSLGLTCKCRNLNNFRPTAEKGYLAVDVPGYEPGGVYSVNQIRRAMDNFKPSEAFSFIKQMALAPQSGNDTSIDFINKKAMLYAFRRAVYEEFDEPYAQAFNLSPARRSEDRFADQHMQGVSRAPLSGPMVTAETLAGGRSNTKYGKVKDHSKRDKYLLKRRDEGSDSKAHPVSSAQASPSVMGAYMEGSSAVAAGEYGLLKRVPDVSAKTTVSAKHEQTRFDGPLSNQIDKEKDGIEERKGTETPEETVNTTYITPASLLGKASSTDLTDNVQQDAMVNIKAEGTMSVSNEGLPQHDLKTVGQGSEKLPDCLSGTQPLMLDIKHDVKHVSGLTTDAEPKKGLKKAKVVKRPAGELGSEPSVMGDKKKKKRKKDSFETGATSHKHLAPGKAGTATRKLVGNFKQVNLPPGEYSRSDQERTEDSASKSVSASVCSINTNFELPQLLHDLHALALDPSHGIERSCSVTAQQFFLRFRSLVYQKSLLLSPPSQTESVESQRSKQVPSARYSEDPSVDKRSLSSSKLVKRPVRSDDPTKAGRKRLPSDRQEELAAKRLKKIKDLKSLAAEKRASLRAPEAHRGEGKETLASAPQKPAKTDLTKGKESLASSPHKPARADLTKKVEPPTRVVDPTMLVMKFPPQTSLPSVAELKARFARFGPLDYSALRVFWKSSTCRVVFKHKVHAQSALKYASRNNNLFGNINVRYFLREVEAPAPEVPESGKSQVDDAVAVSEAPRVKEPAPEQRPISSVLHQPTQQSVVQLKSCLKKHSGDEAAQGNGNNGGRGAPRVKFMLGGEESNRGEQVMISNKDNINNASYADGGASSSVAMDINSKNFQKAVSTSSSHVLHPQLAKNTHNNFPNSEVLPRTTTNVKASRASASPISSGADISQQMLSLLMRCNEVVTDVTGVLGYVPYHPL